MDADMLPFRRAPPGSKQTNFYPFNTGQRELDKTAHLFVD